MHRYCWIDFATPEYDQAVSLRYKVLREPLGMTFNAEDLAKEYDSLHLAMFNNITGKIEGTLMLSPIGRTTVQMRQVAVDPSLQKTGIGSLMVQISESKAKNEGFNKMVLHARDVAIPFYEKLGYLAEGETYIEVGIPHKTMYKDL